MTGQSIGPISRAARSAPSSNSSLVRPVDGGDVFCRLKAGCILSIEVCAPNGIGSGPDVPVENLLLVFLLEIESSYLEDIERATPGPADTIQFLLRDGQAWRIKTYAIDNDVHVWSLGEMERQRFEEFADRNTAKHYGDVLHSKLTIEAFGDLPALKTAIASVGLPANLEVAGSGEIAFWVPVEGIYGMKSAPA